MARHIAKIRWDRQRRSKRKSLPPEELAILKANEARWARESRARRRRRANALRAQGLNAPRPKGSFIRSKRFPRQADYIAYKRNVEPPPPTRSMFFRPWIPPKYQDEWEQYIGIYRMVRGRVPLDVLYQGRKKEDPQRGVESVERETGEAKPHNRDEGEESNRPNDVEDEVDLYPRPPPILGVRGAPKVTSLGCVLNSVRGTMLRG